MEAIQETAKQNKDLLDTLKMHIVSAIKEDLEKDRTSEISVRLSEINKEFEKMLNSLAIDTEQNTEIEQKMAELMTEKHSLEEELKNCNSSKRKAKIEDILTILQGLENHPMKYDDSLIRQVVDCIEVVSEEKLKIHFKGGIEYEQSIA